MAEPVRLSKRVAAQLGCSRREAEQRIEAGLVTVDGAVVDQPQARVHDGQQVLVQATADPQALAPATFLLHKPAGATLEAAVAAMQLLRAHLRRLVPLFPLPEAAAGLCVLSQDPRIVRKLTEDAGWIEQEVLAEVTGSPAPDALQRLGADLKASWQSERRLRLAFKGLDVAALPARCADAGLTVAQLRRIRLGRVPMAGLTAGQWRRLEAHERF